MKITITLEMLFGVSLIFIILIFLSVNLFISGEAKTQKILYEQRQEELKTFQMQNLQSNLITFNNTLSSLSFFYRNQTDSVETIERIVETIPSGIVLSNLSMSPNLNNSINFSLSGFAENRDLLLEFKNNLEKEDLFSEVSFPPSSFLKPVNISFSATFKINGLEQ
ncbi:MAG: PilN domain-containing protein [Candidatus Portnoybacteria bacterium]